VITGSGARFTQYMRPILPASRPRIGTVAYTTAGVSISVPLRERAWGQMIYAWPSGGHGDARVIHTHLASVVLR
jgi:hypothetical protein